MITIDEILKNKPVIIAGPCAVESREQILEVGQQVANLGATIIRTQLWKPRTSPSSFQGVGLEGEEWVYELKEKTGLPVAMEVVSPDQVEQTKGFVDVLWVGSRNMQNYELLKKIGNDERPVILKRGLISTVSEWIGAAEYTGRDKTILCERGIRTGADSMRFTLDINSALVAKFDHKMPVLIDPSHSAGRRDMVEHLSCSAIASGVDGLIIEVHNDPQNALSDADQQILPETFGGLVRKVRSIYELVH